MKRREVLGGKENKAKPEEKLAEVTGVFMAGDALSADEIERLPALRDESPRDQGIMAMVSCGFPQTDVAEAFDVSQQFVSKTVKRIDPAGVFRLTNQAKRAFISKLAEGKGLSALASISLADIRQCTPVEKMRIAKMGMDIGQQLTQSKHKEIGSGAVDGLLAAIEKERLAKKTEETIRGMPEAEVEEVE